MNSQFTTSRSISRRTRTWILGLLILAAFALRVYNLGELDFWLDEAISANISGLGLRGAIEYLRSEPFEHPPLYYLSLYPWRRLAGSGEFSLRFYSVFWGVLFVPLLYAFAKRLTGPRGEHVALLAALLATISPFMVTYSQETRMYMLVPCLAVLLLFSFLNALERDSQPAWWLAYVALLAIGVATHYYFVFVWVALTIYLGMEWLRGRKAPLWSVAIQASVLLVGALWVLAAPGFRKSLVEVWQGAANFDLAYKLAKIMPNLMLSDIRKTGISRQVYLLTAGGWALLVLGAWWSRKGQLLSHWAWRLLMLLLMVPLVGSLFVPYGVGGRHLGYTLIAGLIFMALGLLALKTQGRLWLVVGALVVLLISAYGVTAQYTTSKGDFGQTMAYITSQAQPGDVLVLTHPIHRHLVDYSNKKGLTAKYIPENAAPLLPADAYNALSDLGQNYSRIWLGPLGAWTADPDLLVEHWLTTHAFQAEKTWFSDSSSAALYFTADQELAPIETGELIWDKRILLESVQAGPLAVPAGDALRLRLSWRAGFDIDQRYIVALSLVDDDGHIWAERRSEPCGGGCTTDTWLAGRYVQDQHALLIPPGTPPGTYDLVVAWDPLDGGSALPAAVNGQPVDQVTVAQIAVQHAAEHAREPGPVPNPLQARFGDEISLLGYEPAAFEALPGERIHLETHWQAEVATSADYDLLVELIDRDGQKAATWQVSPVASFYPSSVWLPGEYLRGQHDLTLPGDLLPGRYELNLALVNPSGERLALSGKRPREILGGIVTWQERLEGRELALASGKIIDRPRQFVLPDVTFPLEAVVGRRAHLKGYDLAPAQAHPGEQVLLTLYWQASGPMVKPFKVFTHLVDADGAVLAQHDGQPGAGCCPANTWAEGEVIADKHRLTLDASLPPGAYQLVVGMYDEETDTRLPSYTADGEQLADGSVPVAVVAVEPVELAAQETAEPGSGTPTAPKEPLFDFEYRWFFPMVGVGQQR